MTAAPHPYRQHDRPAKSVVRYWPVPGQLAASLVFLAVLVGLTAWATTRVLRDVAYRLSCTREDGAVTCTQYEDRPLKEPKALWVMENITGAMGPPDSNGIPVTLRGYDQTDDALRFGTLPITDHELATRAYAFLRAPEEHGFEENTGGLGPVATFSPLALVLWCLVVLARMPRPVVFTIDHDRGTFTARFGSLLVRHTTQMPLTDIDRVEVELTTRDLRRLQVVKKDGQVEIFDDKHRPGLHHHHAADVLWGQIRLARRDQV
jgi:hypothetical protein